MTPSYENAKATLCLGRECCEGPVDPVLIRKFFKQAIAAHWEDPNNHGRYSRELSCYNPRSEGGNLSVLMAHEDISGEKISDPRIVVGVQSSHVDKKSLGNVSEVHVDGAHIETGWQINTDLGISHIFNDADVALIAAQSTFEFISGFHSMIMEVLGLNLLEPKAIEGPKIYTKHPQAYFQVDAVFLMNYNFYISVNIESHRLKIIAQDVTINERP